MKRKQDNRASLWHPVTLLLTFYRQVHFHRVHTEHLWRTLQRWLHLCKYAMLDALTKLWKCQPDRLYTAIPASCEAKAPVFFFSPSCLSSVSLQQHCEDSEPTSCCSDWYPRTCFSDKGDTPDWVGGFENYMLVDLYSSPKLLKKKGSAVKHTMVWRCWLFP